MDSIFVNISNWNLPIFREINNINSSFLLYLLVLVLDIHTVEHNNIISSRLKCVIAFIALNVITKIKLVIFPHL